MGDIYIIISIDGRLYEGEWVDDVPYGEGILTKYLSFLYSILVLRIINLQTIKIPKSNPFYINLIYIEIRKLHIKVSFWKEKEMDMGAYGKLCRLFLDI